MPNPKAEGNVGEEARCGNCDSEAGEEMVEEAVEEKWFPKRSKWKEEKSDAVRFRVIIVGMTSSCPVGW